MKKFLLSLCCLLTIQLFAAPYSGEIFEFKQPDGTTVEVKLYGDEFYIRAEGLNGYTVIRDEATGWICYAQLSGTGEKLLSTGIHYNGTQSNGASFSNELNLPKQLDINASALEQIRQANRELLYDKQDLNRATEAPSAPPTGKVKGLSIIVDFSDEPAQLAISDFEAFLNGDNYTTYGNNGSVKEYFSDITGGVIEYQNIVYGWYRAPKTFAAYDAMAYAAGAQEILGLALNWIKSKGFDFSTLTIANGKIRAINLMYTGVPPNWSKGMWHHKGSYTKFSANGVTSGDYNCSPANKPLQLGVVCHENGHMIGEWPDTYKYNTTTGTDGLGAFDVMCAIGNYYNPVYPNPYFLSKNGYGKTIDVTTSGANVNDASNELTFYKYRNTSNSKEFFLVQARIKTGRGTGYPDQGVTIWRINTAGDNQTTTHAVSLVHANNNKDVHTAACYKSGKQEYNDNTTPDAKWLNGNASGLRVWDWGSTGGATMHYKIGSPTTGVAEENELQNAAIYPNPLVDGTLKIDLSHLEFNEQVIITIYDAQGRIVFKKGEKQNTMVSVNMEEFNKGVYFVNLHADQYNANYKIIK
jgi:M6 family metalloprotease-like protein